MPLAAAILESKRMNDTVYFPLDYFTIIHTTKGLNKKSLNFTCVPPLKLFIHLFYIFFNAFPPKITLGPCQGVGVGGGGGCSFVGMATGPKCDVQWAKNDVQLANI